MTVLLLDDDEMRRVRGASFFRGAAYLGVPGMLLSFALGAVVHREATELPPCACGGIPASDVKATLVPEGQTIAFRDAYLVEAWPASTGRIAVVARPGVPIAVGVGTVRWPDGREFDRTTPGAVAEMGEKR